MRVGVGLPNAVPGVPGRLLADWARQAEEAGFASLGVVDRVAYDSHEPMAALAVAAAVTERIELVTMVVIAPLRNTAVLAKQAATIDAVSGGRLTLGVALGARKEDYEVAGVDSRSRGDLLSRQLAGLRSYWEDGVVGPEPGRPGGPDLLVGGATDGTFTRMARYADGYVHGGGPPRTFARAAGKARAAWAEAGRPGEPKLWAQGYFALGDDAVGRGLDYMLDYYAFTGPFVHRIAEGMLDTPQGIMQFVRGYEEAGCEELVLFPTVAEPDQLGRLADVLPAL